MSSKKPTLGSLDRARIEQIDNSDTFVYWSIRHRKLIHVSKSDFKEGEDCQLCVPVYNATTKLKMCDRKFDCYSMYRQHILCMENVYKRPLIWTKENDIPSDLDRKRELADFSLLENEKILKIVYDSVTLVQYQSVLKEYFLKYGCPCEDHKDTKCTGNENEITKDKMSDLKSAQSEKLRHHTRRRILIKKQSKKLIRAKRSASNDQSQLSTEVSMNHSQESNDQSQLSTDQSEVSMNHSQVSIDQSQETTDQTEVATNQTIGFLNPSQISTVLTTTSPNQASNQLQALTDQLEVSINQPEMPIDYSNNRPIAIQTSTTEFAANSQVSSIQKLSGDYAVFPKTRSQSPTISSTCPVSAALSDRSLSSIRNVGRPTCRKSGYTLSAIRESIALKQKLSKRKTLDESSPNKSSAAFDLVDYSTRDCVDKTSVKRSTSGLSNDYPDEKRTKTVLNKSETVDQALNKTNKHSNTIVKRLLICGKLVELTFSDLGNSQTIEQSLTSSQSKLSNESTNESSIDEKLTLGKDTTADNHRSTNESPIDKKITLAEFDICNDKSDAETNLMRTVEHAESEDASKEGDCIMLN